MPWSTYHAVNSLRRSSARASRSVVALVCALYCCAIFFADAFFLECFLIALVALFGTFRDDGSQRAGRVQAMSIGRSAAFQSAQTATCLLLDAKDIATGRRKRPRGLSSCEGSGDIFTPDDQKNCAL